MKKILFVLAIFALTVGAFAQNKGTVTTLTADTIADAGTIDMPLGVNFKSHDLTIAIQAVCTELSGTAAGSIYVEGSLDGTSYETINTTSGFMVAFPNDTLTVVDGGVGLWYLCNTPYNYYRVYGSGSGTESTKVVVQWVYKNK